MAGTAAVLEDASVLSKLDRGLRPIERAFALVSGLAVFSLMFLAAYSVSGRKFFNAPLAGYVDYIEAAMPLIAFMGVSYVQREGGHIPYGHSGGGFAGTACLLYTSPSPRDRG